MKVSAFLRAGHIVSEVANLIGAASPNRLCEQEARIRCQSVNRRAGSGRKAVVDRDG